MADQTYAYNQFTYLHVAGAQASHVHIQGQGSATVINAALDRGGFAQLLAVGGTYPVGASGIISIGPIAKGSSQISLVNASNAAALHAGTDIWLYYGSFQGSCQDSSTVSQCHFGELNTVASISGTTVQLAYPTSTPYYNDGSSSFGLVPLSNETHDLTLQNMTINTNNAVFSVGGVYGLLVDSISIGGSPSHGPFGGGPKRNVSIQNSNWNFGIGDGSFAATDEYDHFTHATFTNNTITGYTSIGSEGAGYAPRLYATEGSSQFTYTGNAFNHASVFFDQTTDDVISNNTFTNGIINVGTSYGTSPTTCFTPFHDPTFVSFASQTSLDIDTNTISIDPGYIFPYLLHVGDFGSSTITNNTLKYASARDLAAITTSSGSVIGNSFTLTGPSASSVGVCLAADESSVTAPTGFNVQGNTVTAAAVFAGVWVLNPNFNDPAPICIKGNTYQAQNGQMQQGPNVRIDMPGSINQSCPQ